MTSSTLRAALAALLLLPVAACAGSTTQKGSAGGTARDTLRWASEGSANNLDIAHGFNGASTLIQAAVLDTMVALDKQGAPAPRLAESWTRPDPKTYLFKLRQGVKFSDGTPLTADDAAFSLARHLDPVVASQAAAYFTSVKSVEPVGADQVKVTMKKPNSAFLALAAIAWQVTPRKLAEAHPKDLGSPEVGTIGTGAFKVDKFSITSGIELSRNPHHWGEKPALSKVEIKNISDPETLRLALQSGEMDATRDVSPREARKWKGMAGVKPTFFPGNNIAYLSLAVGNGPLKDVHVRRAIAHAVNRKAIADLMTQGNGQPAAVVMPPPQVSAVYGTAVPAFKEYPYDIAAAKAELAKSAHAGGFEMKVAYGSTGDSGTVMQAVAADLAKIGIKLTLEPMPADKYMNKMMEHDGLTVQFHELAYGTPDPGELLPDMVGSVAAKPQGFNFSGYSSPELDAKLEDLAASATDEEKRKHVTDMLNDLAEQVPYIPLYATNNGFALNEKFTAEVHTWTENIFAAVRPAGS
ncbi:ABC transporter substrate-binding protein [Sinosporangium siamense]|uniref:ABC transporter substrate-binding protein n=1 Tax=Sinosporangium siamense TaxID=1367973 RepID=A0A919RM43_9ACTN|nr:ABC transporter substrate-binding protein [Sinosporangium siamense]GII94949.1 ABC transporter substrate-binding protein [Sinosporangium siamense]